eukprot:96611_1
MSLQFVKNTNVIHLYISSIGSVIAIIVITIAFINILYHYFKIFNNQTADCQNMDKTNFILFFIICILSLFLCIQYAFVRRNVFTQQIPSTFTHTQCAFGFYGSFAVLLVFQSFIFYIMLYRIRLAFNNTTFRYSNKIFLILGIPLIIIILICLTGLFATVHETYYVLEYFGNRNNIFCGVTANKNSNMWNYHRAAVILDICAQTFYDFVLLYMFTNRLYTLQNRLVDEHLNRVSTIHTSTSINNTSSIQSDIEMESPISSVKEKRILTIGDLESEQSKNDSAKRIMELHQLIKRHTILIFIIVLTSLIWLFLLIFVSGEFIMDIGWLAMINVVCFWFMFAS